MIVTQQVFENDEDYCTFLKMLAMSGYTRHHSAQYPRTRWGLRQGQKGYCEKYKGIYGEGWKIIIFMSATTHYNDRVIYYVKGEKS